VFVAAADSPVRCRLLFSMSLFLRGFYPVFEHGPTIERRNKRKLLLVSVKLSTIRNYVASDGTNSEQEVIGGDLRLMVVSLSDIHHSRARSMMHHETGDSQSLTVNHMRTDRVKPRHQEVERFWLVAVKS
jgi:hypothetical protein